MSALRWVILLAVVATAALLLYLATSDPTARVDPERDGRTVIDRERTETPANRSVEEAAGEVYRVALKVVLPGGGPAPHALIEIHGPISREDIESNESGEAGIEGLPPGRYLLLCTSGRATGALEFEILARDLDLGTLKLVTGIQIRGKVLDAKGAPLAGAQVEALAAAGRSGGMDMTGLLRRMTEPDRVVSRALTGDDGAYVLTVPRAASVQLRATASGHAQEGYPARSFGEDVEGVDFHMMPGAIVAGRVSGPGGRPVPGAQVLLVDPMMVFGSGLPKCETRADAEGRFELTPAPAEQMMLIVHASGFAMYANDNLVAPVLDLAVELEPGITVKLKAVDKEDPTRPATGVDVTVVYGGGLDLGRTDERGELVLTHVSDAEGGGFGGEKMALLWGGGFVPLKVDLSSLEPKGGVLDLGVIALEAGGTLRGQITDAVNGKPIEGAMVRTLGGLERELQMMGSPPAHTNSEGYYESRGVPLGANTVLATHPDYTFDPQVLMRQFGGGQSGKAIFEPGRREAERNLKLQPARVLRGKVVGPDDQPVSGARVGAGDQQSIMLSAFLGGSPPVVFTDAKGEFVLTAPVSLMGTPRITATHRDYGPAEPVPLLSTGPEEIVLRLPPPHFVRGRVLDAEGEPVAAVRVRAQRKTENPGELDFGMPDPLSRQSTTSDDEGRFLLRNAPSGEVELHYEHTDYVPGQLEIFIDRKTGETTAPDLVLKRGEQIVGIVVAPSGKGKPGVHVFGSFAGTGDVDGASEGRSWGNATTDQEGKFVLGGLRRGLFRLNVSEPGHYCRESNVSTGDDTVRLVLVEAVALKGRVLSRGIPVAGAWVQAKLRLGPAEGEKESWDYLDSQRTDAKGEFRLDEIPPKGGIRVEIRHDLYRNATFDDVVPDDQVRTFHLQAGQRVSGIVVDENNQPLAGVQIEVTDGNEIKSVHSGEDGSFAAGGLVSDRVRLQTLGSGMNLVAGEETEVVAGSRNVRLVVTKGLSIEGRIRGLEAHDSPWNSLSALDAEGEQVQSGSVNVSDGSFALHGLPPGRYTLQVAVYKPTGDEDGTYEEEVVGVFEGIDAGTTGLELTLPK